MPIIMDGHGLFHAYIYVCALYTSLKGGKPGRKARKVGGGGGGVCVCVCGGGGGDIPPLALAL